MELEKFIEDVASQFSETEKTEFCSDTEYKYLEEWTSLSVLLLQSMIDERYDVIVTGDEINDADTIEDLFNIVKNKKG